MRTITWLSTVVLALSPILVQGAPLPERGRAKVALIQVQPGEHEDPFLKEFDITKVRPKIQAHLDRELELFEQAGALGADIVCGPEDMQHIGTYGLYLDTRDPATGEVLFNSLAESVPGPLTERISTIAARHGMYILAPIYEKAEGKVYNCTLLFDRQGRIVGRHRKTHLPIMETWLVTPGDSLEVFDTDFGRVAVATCWEIIFPEITSIYALKGADIVFHPTMGHENEPGQSLSTAARYLTRARDNFIYLAPVITGQDGCGVIDPRGKVLAEAVGDTNKVILTEIDFSREPLSRSRWWNTINGTDNEKAMIFLSRNPALFQYLTETHPELLERYGDIRLTRGVGNTAAQLEAVHAVDYGK